MYSSARSFQIYRSIFFSTILILLNQNCLIAQNQKSLINAVVANDQENSRPALEAIEKRFSAIVVEVNAGKNGEVMAGKHSFEKLYLSNLKKLLPANNGWLFEQPEELVMFVVLKDDPLKLWDSFCKVVDQYQELFTSFNDGVRKKGPIRLVVSGKLPIDDLIRNSPSWYGIMVPLNEAEKYEAWRNPVVMFDYKKHFKWKGDEHMPNAQYHSLLSYSKNVHKANKLIYLSNTYAGNNYWNILLGAGVDYIEIDNLQSYIDFVRNRYK